MKNTSNMARGFRALLLAGGAGTIALAVPAFAQDAAPSGSADSSASSDGGDTIVVTGSRIAKKDFESNSPVVTVGSQLLDNSSTGSVEVNLNKLPQFAPEKTPTCITCGGDIQATPTNTPGSATVSLRGIGSNRNLVLIDGRRATPGNASMAVDVNTIPSAAIERVEIISGGASSTYGADAVGGVVNFILKKNFQGLSVDAQYGVSQRGDSEEYNISGIMGTNFADGRGNISVAMSTSDRKSALRQDRPWFKKAMQDPDIAGTYFILPFSGMTQTGGNNPTYQALLNSMFPNIPAGSNMLTTGNLYFLGNTPFTAGGIGDIALGATNYPDSAVDGQYIKRTSLGNLAVNHQFDYIDLPLTRYNFYMRGNYEINDWISVIAQGYFNESHTHTVQEPGPIVGGWNVNIPRYANDSDWLPANMVALLNARTDPSAPWSLSAFVPGVGNREVDTHVNTYNMVAGFEGSVPGTDWTWDATVQRRESTTNALTTGVLSLERLRAVLGAPNFGKGFSAIGNPAGGTFGANAATCTSGLNPFDPNLVVSQDCLQAVEAPLKESATMTQTIWEANAQGKLFDVPAGEVRAALGATYRDNKYTFLEDNLKEGQSGFLDQALGIYPARSIDSDLSSKEVYGEINVPLIHDTPGIKLLELNGGIRYADSSQTGGSTTWKVEANWEVTDWFRLRGTYNKAERAPNVGELYSYTQNFALLTGGDACSLTNPYAYSANPANANGAAAKALCVALMDKTNIPGQPLNSQLFYGRGNPGDPDYIPVSGGATNSSIAPGFAFPYFVGNPDLKPEDAKTITLGAVISSPSSDPVFSRMRLSVDYYNIKVNNAIGLQSGQTLQQLCMDPTFNPTLDPNNLYCQYFARGTGGGIGAVKLGYTNTGAFKTSGIDVQFDWNVDVGPGKLSLNSVFNYLISFKTSPFWSGIPTDEQTPFKEYAGLYTGPSDSGLDGGAQYRWKLFTTANYSIGGLTVGLQWQHLPGIASGSTGTYSGAELSGFPAYDLFSLNTSYAITDNVTLRFGIDNLFDKAPPLGLVDPVTIPALNDLPGGSFDTNDYDALGRRFYFGVNTRF